jgi:hypothetical protein
MVSFSINQNAARDKTAIASRRGQIAEDMWASYQEILASQNLQNINGYLYEVELDAAENLLGGENYTGDEEDEEYSSDGDDSDRDML